MAERKGGESRGGEAASRGASYRSPPMLMGKRRCSSVSRATFSFAARDRFASRMPGITAPFCGDPFCAPHLLRAVDLFTLLFVAMLDSLQELCLNFRGWGFLGNACFATANFWVE